MIALQCGILAVNTNNLPYCEFSDLAKSTHDIKISMLFCILINREKKRKRP